ncbi:hypothetical protein DM02DRAFT_428160 [Periconia macrospinosa]|uniref:RING-type E3 ubiquitin transferase n=1 Tax=Periconia macrospinosa TaxID=97972 RepID=A0A2V1EAG1_9PLEO|nr:hypothetical protein DM02DRAFT_428160 [Periconia macrospinosa]
MRPLRLLLSLCTSVIAFTLLLYMVFGPPQESHGRYSSGGSERNRASAFFSFTSPSSLFPPSAIISLTDDNSTFFLARPAAFGPSLPSTGLSGALWIGSGFGDEAMGTGELGCSDVPGWNDGDDNITILGLKTPPKAPAHPPSEDSKSITQAKNDRNANPSNDGTDDHLHKSNPATSSVAHADIESIQESAEIKGKVVLLKRGGCGFLEKVRWAQRRGGVALIVGDDVRGGVLVRMYARGDTSDVAIPALFTSHTTAHLLSSLLPTGGTIQDLSPEDLAKLNLVKGGTSGKSKAQQNSAKHQNKHIHAPKSGESSREQGWFRSLLLSLGFGDNTRSNGNQRPPSSGKLDWTQLGNGRGGQQPVVTDSSTSDSAPTPATGDFVIGEQDWRDTTLAQSTTSMIPIPRKTYAPGRPTNGRVNLPSSGEYSDDATAEENGWLHGLLGGKRDLSELKLTDSESEDGNAPDSPSPHEGLWVTLSPTNMSTSPFFDTLLVLVVSPLVTLTVVYALLLLRSRIRRRRWRAPKSIVERLPVRTYHTISDISPAPTPTASSPTTPLLQHPPPSESPSRARSAAESETPAASSSFLQPHGTSEEDRRESGLAAWRRRYGGRQKECVVCLEEYEDGVSQVMSLPCGHEFHADCITPWLVTRRRTCPICKGDVVRSLSQSYRDRAMAAFEAPFHDELDDDIQAQAVETHNDSPSASRPVPISSSNIDDDVEANWAGEEDDGRAREISQSRGSDLSSSLREVSSSVATTIWRGFEAAVGRTTSVQRRPSREDVVDRDR